MGTNNQLLNLLGLARRAGKLDLGTEAVKQAVRKHRAKLVLLAADLSPGTAASVSAAAGNAGVRASPLNAGMDEVEAALGKRTGVIAVNDEGFAEALRKLSPSDRGGTNE